MTPPDHDSTTTVTGLWRASPQSQGRDVSVVIDHGALVMRDPRNGAVLAHWALAATERLNPGGLPALYAPQRDTDGETLEMDDPALSMAIDDLRAQIAARRPRPGRLRLAIFASLAAGVLAAAVFWFPGALVGHAAGLVPAAKRAEIGRAALVDLTRLTGAPCAAPDGLRALGRLSDRLFGPGGGRIVILREGLAGVGGAAHLPGRLILLDRALVETVDTPDLAAAHALAEALRAEAHDPLIWLLHEAGLAATARLMTTGVLPPDLLVGTGTSLLTTQPAPIDPAALAAQVAKAGLAMAPYARSQSDAPFGQAMEAAFATALQATPTQTPQRMILPDADWISLQGICAR